MNKITRTLGTLTTLLLAAGCSGSFSEQPLPPTAGEGVLSFRTTIAGATRSVVVMGSGFAHEAQMNLMLMDQDGNTTCKGAMKPYIYKKPTDGAGAWIPGAEEGHKLVTESAQVLAHYPAVLPAGGSLSADKGTLTVDLPFTVPFGTPEEYNADNAFWVALEADKGDSEVLLAEGETDYMMGCGANTVNNIQQATTLTMYHALSMVVVRARKDAENPNPGKLKSIALVNKGGATTLRKGSFALATHTFTPSTTTMSYTRTMEDFPDGTCFALMVYPTTIAANQVEMQLSVDQVVFKLDIPAGEWQAGRIFFYNVTLKATSAVLNTGLGVLPWPDRDEGNNVPLD